jgi:hypothetical protein
MDIILILFVVLAITSVSSSKAVNPIHLHNEDCKYREHLRDRFLKCLFDRSADIRIKEASAPNCTCTFSDKQLMQNAMQVISDVATEACIDELISRSHVSHLHLREEFFRGYDNRPLMDPRECDKCKGNEGKRADDSEIIEVIAKRAENAKNYIEV